MKLVIELDDENLRRIAEQQVQKAVAAFTEGAIQRKVEEILELKMNRLTGDRIDAELKTVIKAFAEEYLGASDYLRRNKINTYFAEAAMKIVKENLK